MTPTASSCLSRAKQWPTALPTVKPEGKVCAGVRVRREALFDIKCASVPAVTARGNGPPGQLQHTRRRLSQKGIAEKYINNWEDAAKQASEAVELQSSRLPEKKVWCRSVQQGFWN